MVNDPIADFLSRVRNAQQRKKEDIRLPASKMLVGIAELLKSEGFISDYTIEEVEPRKELVVELKYVDGQPAIRSLKRISKPGLRKYRGYKEIKPIKQGMGINVFSTPKGLLTGEQAVKEKVGGEYICDIY